MKPFSFLLINLPIPEFYNKIQRGLTQVFSDYIQAILINKNIKNIKILKLERIILESYNNKALIEEITKLKPDAVGFSNYLWNIERNIQIADQLKKFGIITIAGGPEINSKNDFILNNKSFDYMLEGEGEYNLIDIINKIISKKKIDNYFISGNSIVDFNDFIEKYAEITQDYKYDKLFYFEIERGCPYNCIYCSYGKNRTNINSINDDIFNKLIEKIIKKDINEIYFLSPTFNRDKLRFKKHLTTIINEKNKIKKDIKLFAELRPELIDEEDITLMKEAGFNEIEFGVQTLNLDSHNLLNRAGKKFDLKNFVKKLTDNGISPLIDFIIGIPNETIDEIFFYIAYLDKHDILKYSQFYQLHVLSNTKIRSIFDDKKYDYMKEPPYFAMKTDTLNYTDIKSIYYYLENNKNLSYYHDFFDFESDNFYIIKNNKDFDKLENNKFYHSASFIYLDNFNEQFIINFFESFFKSNSEIFHISYIYSDKKYSVSFLKSLNAAFIKYKNFYDLFTDNINYNTNQIMSKMFYLMIKPDNYNKVNYIKDYLTGFVVFPEEINKLEKYKKNLIQNYEDESIYTYLFNDNKYVNLDFVRIFPKNNN